jgi:hypothetical protein
MNCTASAMPTTTGSPGGLSGDTIANITLDIVNITMAAAQLLLGYLTYRTSRSE